MTETRPAIAAPTPTPAICPTVKPPFDAGGSGTVVVGDEVGEVDVVALDSMGVVDAFARAEALSVMPNCNV